ncbi:hypothetical protein [Vulcanisaeta souniana]|uniref:hypothetical protein n=1 Tax=Vulcanisaeta souniana TaxID=164452 RepID=UPI001FB4CF1C|nr:hypothetical protein [Vulcanisaeta souniana]
MCRAEASLIRGGLMELRVTSHEVGQEMVANGTGTSGNDDNTSDNTPNRWKANNAEASTTRLHANDCRIQPPGTPIMPPCPIHSPPIYCPA